MNDLPFALDTKAKLKWTSTQESSISTDFPFDLANETPELYVGRIYLQHLWLPDSIMPLSLLVPSMTRVADSATSLVHPLHELLEPLLMTTRSASNKYNVELRKILSNGGGAGELEEMTMWYALTHEKVPHDHAEEPWVDEQWRAAYLDRMERREAQIQILLYFLKLSLPPPPSQPSPSSSPRKKKKQKLDGSQDMSALKICLESFMDKLSMWQLLAKLDSGDNQTPELDWMQQFCTNVVEPQFKTDLPDLCSLLRSKVFPNSPFSDDSHSPPLSRSPSPETAFPQSKYSSSPSSRYPSPLPATTSTSNSQRDSSVTSLAPSSRARSRSLSVSLAQERERERAGSVGLGGSAGAGAVGKKRVLNREVSMSRVFKAKPKRRSTSTTNGDAPFLPGSSTAPAVDVKPEVGRTLRRELSLSSFSQSQAEKDVGVTLVDATPVKPRPTLKGRRTATRPVPMNAAPTLIDVDDEEGDEDGWALPSLTEVANSRADQSRGGSAAKFPSGQI